MAGMSTSDGWPVARPVRTHRPLAAALGLSVSLHLALLAGLHLHLPTVTHPLLRPAPLIAYLAPPAPPHAAVSRRLPNAAANSKKVPARHIVRPAAAVRQPPLHHAQSLHPATPLYRAPKPRQQPTAEAPAHLEAGRARALQRVARPRPPALRLHPQVANSPAPRHQSRPTPQEERPYPEAAPVQARRTRAWTARPHAPVVTRQASIYDAPIETGTPDRASPTSHRRADAYGYARQPGRVTAGGGMAASVAALAPARGPGSDIRVLGRSQAMAPSADPAAEGMANGAGNSAAGELADRSLALLAPVHPEYPQAARRDNIEGAVVVRIWVDAAGNVSNVQVLRASPPGYFEAAAIAAVRQWHYAPALHHGRPVAAVVAGYTLRFRLLDADE